MRKTVLTFGLMSAALSVAMMLATVPLLDSVGYEKTDLIGYTTIVLSALLVFFGVRSHRDNAGAGRISFGRAFAVGLLITLVSCACSVVAFQVVRQPAHQRGAELRPAVPDRARRQRDLGSDPAQALIHGASSTRVHVSTANLRRFTMRVALPFSTTNNHSPRLPAATKLSGVSGIIRLSCFGSRPP